MFGNRTDHFQHTPDPRALAGQGLNDLDRFINGGGQLIDLLQAAVDALLALFGAVLGITHFS
ncbi:hypothetical protein D3C80_2180410 [compost metagenome]